MRLTLLVLVLAGLVWADPPWSAAVKAADVGDSINEGESDLAFDGDYVYCISNTNERNRYPVIPYGRSTDGGQTWTTTWWNDPSVGITWHTDPVLLCDDTGYVHMFIQFSSQLLRHYLSTDHGLTWCDSADVSVRGRGVDKPWACHYGNELYACWQQTSEPEGIILAKSTDGGRSWSVSTIDDRTGITGICASPSGIIYIVLRYWSGDSLFVFKSTDGGATWPQKVMLDAECTYEPGYGDRAPMPSIAAPTDSNLFVTLVDQRRGNWDVFYSRSSDAGATWPPLALLNDSTEGGQCKGWVASDPLGGLHMLWYHTPSWPTSASSWWSVRYQHSGDFGRTIGASIRLNDTVFRSPVSFMGEYHIIEADSELVRCVWADGREGDLDLWFAQAELSAIGVEENPFQVFRVKRVGLWVPPVARQGAVPLEFSLSQKQEVRILVFDALGRRLRSMDLGLKPQGRHSFIVKGLEPGQTVFVRLEAGEVVTGKCTFVR